MNRPSTARLLATVLAVTTVTAGCGLKSEATDSLKSTGAAGGAAVANTGTGAGAAGVPAPAGSAAPGSGGTVAAGPAGSGTTAGSTTGSSSTTSTSGTTTTGGGRGGGGGATTTTGGACGTPSGGDTTGITSSTINIGLHAPLTGTGTPFPNSSFQAGAGTFWEQPGHTVCGRKVQVEFQDDTYTPAGATQRLQPDGQARLPRRRRRRHRPDPGLRDDARHPAHSVCRTCRRASPTTAWTGSATTSRSP